MPTIAYLGNFGPPNSTENDLVLALRGLGHTVIPLQEELLSSWLAIFDLLEPVRVDMILWTRTASLAAQVPVETQRRMQLEAALVGVPTVGYHLDRWWNLQREADILIEPWFRCEHIFTADGAHDAEWAAAGVWHHWMPPAIASRKVMRGSFREDYAFDIAFVGSWMGGYHDEWPHRAQLIDHLRNNYGDRVGFFPRQPGDSRIDGGDRADLFASAKVIVGDSCLVPLADGTPMHSYISDRVFESLGQGACFIHPKVKNVTDGTLITNGEHLRTWQLYDWAAFHALIDELVGDAPQRAAIAEAGFAHTAAWHTYENRLRDLLIVLGLTEGDVQLPWLRPTGNAS